MTKRKALREWKKIAQLRNGGERERKRERRKDKPFNCMNNCTNNGGLIGAERFNLLSSNLYNHDHVK